MKSSQDHIKIKNYVLITLVPFICIFLVFLIYLGHDLLLIKKTTENSILEINPSVNNIQKSSNYIVNLQKDLLSLAYGDDSSSKKAILFLKENIITNQESVKTATINNFLHAISLTYRNRQDVQKTRMLLNKEIDEFYKNLYLVYEKSYNKFPFSKLAFYKENMMQSDTYYDNLLKSTKDILDDTLKNICSNTRYLSAFESCQLIEKSYNMLTTYHQLYNSKRELLGVTYKNASNEISNIATEIFSKEDSSLLDNLKMVNENINLIGNVTTYVSIVCLCLFSILYLVIYINFVKPLLYISNMISEFRHNMKIPKDPPRTRIKEIHDIYTLLLPLLNRVNYIILQNETLTAQYKEMSELTYIDDLTQVNNRRALNKFLNKNKDEILLRTAFLMVDIDFFKKLNDTAGHQKGDEVLYTVAQCLSKNIIRKDMVYRYGGEEFCIILLNVDEEDALKTASRLVREIESLNIPHAGLNNNPVTVSIGVSHVNLILSETNKESYSLIKQADIALYQAKNSGRNRACLYNDSLDKECLHVKEYKSDIRS